MFILLVTLGLADGGGAVLPYTPLYPVEEFTEVEGVEGGSVKLPCQLFPMREADRINLILWYKNDEKDPIFSYDARGAVFSSEKHHLKQSLLKGRVTFTPSPGDPIPHKLTLSRLQQVDAGQYTCRVDFTVSQSSSKGIILRVVTPVNSLQILDSQRRQLPSVLDPIPEGGTLNITCTAKGGRPQPSVTWWVNDAKIDDSWTEVAKGVVSNNLVISPLTREHAHAILTCRAAPSPVATSTAAVTIDMYLKPESVEIKAGGSGGTIRAGDYLDLTCFARGSRPVPTIKWYKGAEVIPTKKSSLKAIMGVSAVSHTRIKIQKEDDGARVTCRVTNPALPHHTLQEHISLNVTYPPEVELRMGSTLEGTVVKESSDLYLTCHVDANPEPQTVTFTHQGVVVEQNIKRGIVISGHDLVLRGIQRSQNGVYTCRAVNNQGTGISPQVNITVLYAPVCQHAPDVWAEPGTHVTASCSVNSSPADKIHFSWVWVTPTYSRRIMPALVKVRDLTSNVSFVIPQDNGSLSELGPSNKLGTLQCWAMNDVGRQNKPCTVDVRRPIACTERLFDGRSSSHCMIPKHPRKPPVIPAPPSAPINCSLTGEGREGVRVTCQPGDTRTVPQTYQLQIYEAKTRKLHINVTSQFPSFLVPNLTAGRDYTVYVSSHTSFGGSPFKLVEAFNFKTAENRMPTSQEDSEPISWMTIIIFVSSVGGLILVILFVTTLIRIRIRRSQHKCTVRRTPSAQEPKLADKNLYLDTPPEVPSTTTEKKFVSENEPSQPDNISPLKTSPRDPLNPPPIIRQNTIRLQPIIKENGRAEPVRSSQPRTVLFVEPPKSRPEVSSRQDISVHKEELPRPAYDMLYPGRRGGGGLSSKGHNGDVRSSIYPSSRSAYSEPQTGYSERDMKFRNTAGPDDLIEPDVYETQFSSGSSNTLSRESGYCSPRHPLGGSYRGVASNTAPHDNPPLREPSRDLRDARETRDSREPPHIFNFPLHGRDGVSSHYNPPLRRSSSSPPPPRPSIMKKSPSMSGSIYKRHEHLPQRPDGTTYRSLPRPNKPSNRHMDQDRELQRYRSLDRRFDLPFTGSLPRPQTRRGSRSDRRIYRSDSSRFEFRGDSRPDALPMTSRSSDTRLDRPSDIRQDARLSNADIRYDSRSSVRSLRDSSFPQRRSSNSARLRFSNEKYFHVYSDKDKKQTCDDEVDENFV